MTTYRVESDETGHHLVASWPDLPERASQSVAIFEDLKLASVAKSVLSAASRYRWRRWLELLDAGIFSEEQVPPDPTPADRSDVTGVAPDSGGGPDQPSWLPRLPTTVILGDSTMGAYLEERIERLLPEAGGGPEPVDPERSGFGAQVPLGNLRPLLWRDWFSHLQADEHDHLAAELDEDLSATAGPLVGRARQIAWYLSAELLVDEDDPKLAANHADAAGGEGLRDFQRSLVDLLAELIGFRVESTAVEVDPDHEGLLRVHSPRGVVGFWLDDEESWYYGWPDPDSPNDQPTSWLHAGTLPSDTSVGDLASFITESVARGVWPFAGQAPQERRGLFGGRRRSSR